LGAPLFFTFFPYPYPKVADGGRFFDKRQRGWFNDERPWLMSVENPIDSTHDVGANAFNFRSVRRACAHAYCSLLSADARAQRGEDAGSSGEPGFVPWDETTTAGQGTSSSSRPRLFSSFLDVEDEMAQRFAMHAAEANAPIATLAGSSEGVEVDGAAWEAMGRAEGHGEEEGEEASASQSSDEGQPGEEQAGEAEWAGEGEEDGAGETSDDAEMRSLGWEGESNEHAESPGLSESEGSESDEGAHYTSQGAARASPYGQSGHSLLSESESTESETSFQIAHGGTSPRAGKSRAASAASSPRGGPGSFQSRGQRREAAARAKPQAQRLGLGPLKGIGKKARAALAKGKKAVSKLRENTGRPTLSPSQNGRSPTGKGKAKASPNGNSAHKGASPKKGKRTMPAATHAREAAPVRRTAKTSPIAKKPIQARKQPASGEWLDGPNRIQGEKALLSSSERLMN
jgi:hypothetical protein